jgi:biotin operon repressor
MTVNDAIRMLEKQGYTVMSNGELDKMIDLLHDRWSTESYKEGYAAGRADAACCMDPE